MKLLTASFDHYADIRQRGQGMYAWLSPNSKSIQKIIGMLSDAPFKTFDGTELHVTLIHVSKDTDTPDCELEALPQDQVVEGLGYHLEHWVDHKQRNIVVLRVESKQLIDMFDELAELGFKHSYHEYNAHMTVAKGIELNAEDRMWLDKTNAMLIEVPLDLAFNPELFVTSQA